MKKYYRKKHWTTRKTLKAFNTLRSLEGWVKQGFVRELGLSYVDVYNRCFVEPKWIPEKALTTPISAGYKH